MLLYCRLREEEALRYLGVGEPLDYVPEDLPLAGREKTEVRRLLFAQQILSSSRGATSSSFVATATARRNWLGIIPAWTNPEAPARKASRASSKSKCGPKTRIGGLFGLTSRWRSMLSEPA